MKVLALKAYVAVVEKQLSSGTVTWTSVAANSKENEMLESHYEKKALTMVVRYQMA
jgi:hypothetical protein